jgi:vacuolar-type H+-ATPase subunit C/Vma6
MEIMYKIRHLLFMTTNLVEACTQKLVDDWAYLRENAGEPLGQFLDYCTYGHMIDNVVLIVTGTLHERDVNELLDKCHPLRAVRFPGLPWAVAPECEGLVSPRPGRHTPGAILLRKPIF